MLPTQIFFVTIIHSIFFGMEINFDLFFIVLCYFGVHTFSFKRVALKIKTSLPAELSVRSMCYSTYCVEPSLDLRLSCFNRSAQASAMLNLDKITTIGNKNERRFQHLSLLADQKSRTSIKIELKFVNNSFPFRPSVISRLEHIGNDQLSR